MSLALVQSRALLGLRAPAVTVEVHLANGLPSFTLVGLADVEVKEARERVRSALQNAGLEFPHNKRITVNLAPADLPKDSGRFDLPIALGILAASGQLSPESLAGQEFAGELSLTGELRAVRGALAQLVLPGDNPDVASLVLEHENGALSTLNASYASASEYYLMNIYGKEASAYYDLHNGLRFLKRGANRADAVPCEKSDTIVEELEEFARAVRGEGKPEMDGEKATASLAVLLAGIKSARENRRVAIAEVLVA